MKGAPVPDSDHILRYVGGRHIDKDATGTPVVTGGGFIAKPSDNNEPSYNWLECLGGTLGERVQQVRDLARINYGATAKLARLNVGCVRNHIANNTNDGHSIAVIQDPLEAEEGIAADPSHALMTNIPGEDDPEGELIGDLIAECVIDTFAARVAD